MGDVCKLVINVTFIFLWARTETWWPVASTHSFLSLSVWCSVPSTLELTLILSLPSFFFFLWFILLAAISLSAGGSQFFNSFLNGADKIAFFSWSLQPSLIYLWTFVASYFPPNIWRFVAAKKEKVIETITLASSRLNYRDLCSRACFTIISWNMLSLSPFGSKKTQEHSRCFSSHFSITVKAAHPYA